MKKPPSVALKRFPKECLETKGAERTLMTEHPNPNTFIPVTTLLTPAMRFLPGTDLTGFRVPQERQPGGRQRFIFIFIMAYMTQEGYDKMVAQLRKMETIDRPAASAAIAEARDKGDLSENSEYDAAKEAQAMLEIKINNLKATIADAKIIDASKLRSDVVQILSTVEMKNVKNGMVMKYTIVSESEANLREGKISSTTPIAQGLLGKKVGDIVDVKIPQGTIQLEILSISVSA